MQKDVTDATDSISKKTPARPDVDVDLTKRSDASLPNKTAADSAALANQGVLGNLTITDSAATKEAQLLRDAVTHKNFNIWNAPDVAAMERILAPESSANRAAVQAKYADLYGTKFSDDLNANVGDAVSTDTIKAMLTRVDGRTNFGGDVQVALDTAKSDPDKGNRLLRAAVINLNSEQISQMASDVQATYGMQPTDLTPANATDEQKRQFALGLQLAKSGKKPATDAETAALNSYQKAFINDFIATAPGITDASRQLISVATNGVDQRTADDIKKMANIAVDSNDLKMFADVINGDTPAAIQARQELSADSNFTQKYNQTFVSNDKSDIEKEVAADLLSEGNVSLATIIKGDTHVFMGLLDNPENLDLAASNASPTEKQEFSLGKQLSLSGRQPSNDQESAALAYYNKIDQAMTSVNMSNEQRSRVEDELQHGGKTLVSNLMDLGRGASAQSLLNGIENMSEADYDLLHTDKSYMDDVLKGLYSVGTDEDVQPELNKMLAEKAAAPTFEASQGIKRSVLEVFQDTKTQVGGATMENVADAIATMSPSDAAKYQSDADYRKQVDDVVQNNLSDVDKILATSVLQQVAQTGKSPELTLSQQIAKGVVDGATELQQLSNVEKLLQDPSLRARLSATSGLSQEDQDLKTVIQKAMPIGTDELLKNGLVPMGLKLNAIGVPKSQLFAEVAKLPVADQAEYTNDYDASEQEVFNAVVAQNGTMRLEDKIRGMVLEGGTYQDLQPELSKLTDAQKSDLIREYETKYHSNLSNDFMPLVGASDTAKYQGYISPSSDGDQTHFNNEMQNGGDHASTLDASGQVIDRSLHLEGSQLAEFQAQMKTLPPDVQAKITELIKTADAQNQAAHIDEIKKLGKGALDGGLVVAAVASGGLLSELVAADGAATAAVASLDLTASAATDVAVDAATDAAVSSANVALAPAIVSAGAPSALAVEEGITDTSEAAIVAPNAVAKAPALFAGEDSAATTTAVAPSIDAESVDASMSATNIAPRAPFAVTADQAVIEGDQASTDIVASTSRAPFAASADQAVIDGDQASTDIVASTPRAPFAVTADQAVIDGDQASTDIVASTARAPFAVSADQAVLTEEPAANIAVDSATSTQNALVANGATSTQDAVLADSATSTRTVVAADSATAPENAAVADSTSSTQNAVVADSASAPENTVVADSAISTENAATANSAPSTQNVVAADSATSTQNLVAADSTTSTENAVVADSATSTPNVVAADSVTAPSSAAIADSATAGDTATLNSSVDTSLALKPAVQDLATADRSLAATDGTVAPKATIQAAAATTLSMAASPSDSSDNKTDATPPNDAEDAPPTVPNDNIIKLATVRRGEGPFQSAERILFQAEGKRPGIDEVRILTKALQQTFSPERNGNHDMAGLKVNYQFITKENFADVIAAVQDPTVKAQLMQFAAAS